MTSPPPDAKALRPDDFALRRVAGDMRARTRLGGIYYVIAWLLIWSLSRSPHNVPLRGVAIALWFALLLALRFLHKLPESADAPILRRWIGQTWALLLVTSLSWGLVQGWIASYPEYTEAQLVAAISTVAFATAMVTTFPMNLTAVAACGVAYFAPGFWVMSRNFDHHRPILITLAIYMTYVALAAKRNHAEYAAHLKTEQELLEQRERYELLSRTDSLTQLGNRAQFTALFAPLASLARRRKTPLSLVLFDIDHFKRVNDQHGHAAGDLCLRGFADCLREKFRRESDVLARLGGEEFAVLMPDLPAEEARRLADELRASLASRRWDWSGHAIGLAVSAGVGELDPARDRDVDAFFQRVDRARYRAKEEGRDRVVRAA